MGNLHHVIGAAVVHEGLVDVALDDHGTHRHRTIGDLLGDVEDVRRDPEFLGAAHGAHASEAGDDLIEDQQDVVLVAYLAQALEIAHWRRQHAGRACHRLDDDGGDVGGIMQRDQLQQLIGALGAGPGHAGGEGILLEQGMRQVIGIDS